MEGPSTSGIKPRQLEPELSGAAGNKRRASMEQTAQDISLGADQQHKRPRAASLGFGMQATPAFNAAGAPLAAPATAPAAQQQQADDLDGPTERPDVFAYFAERASHRQELERSVERLQTRESQLDRRLNDAELQISRLKAEAAAATARHEAREAQIDLQRQQVEAALKKEVARSTDLEIRLSHAKQPGAGTQGVSAAAAASQAVQDAEAEDVEHNRNEAAAARELRVQITALQLELERAASDAVEASRRADARVEEERRHREAAEATVQALQRQVDDAAAEAEAAGNARRHAESRCAELEAEVLGAHATAAGSRSSEGETVLIKSLREQLKTAEAVAADAARLRQQAADAAVLRERLELAESRARRAEGALESEEAVHAELASAQAELERWKAVLSGVADCTTPEDVLRMVRRLQDQQVQAAAGAGDRAEVVAEARSDAEAAGAAAREAEARVEAQRTRADAAEAALARVTRRVELLTRERDGLKSVLSTYDEEYLAEQGADISREQRRIAELEATVEALHGHIASLESEAEVRQTNDAKAVEATATADAIARAETAETRVRAAEEEIEGLARQVASLQERVARGEYNPETTKVLHFRNNPEAELQRAAHEARVAQLETENEALRQNIQRLEASGAGGRDAAGGLGGENTPGGGGASLRIAQLEGEANLLRRRLSEAQKASDRLQQVFTRQISTFREAVAGLFGYRVEMTSDPSARDIRAEFVLRPLKADEAGAELAFRLMRDGRLAMVPTEYSKRRLAREVETFVDRFRSVPALTANLTMENFQRQTQA